MQAVFVIQLLKVILKMGVGGKKAYSNKKFQSQFESAKLKDKEYFASRVNEQFFNLLFNTRKILHVPTDFYSKSQSSGLIIA